jgi:hypothetical protein
MWQGSMRDIRYKHTLVMRMKVACNVQAVCQNNDKAL